MKSKGTDSTDFYEREVSADEELRTLEKVDSQKLLSSERVFENEEKDERIIELEKQLEGYGKLSVEKDILERELESLQLMGNSRKKCFQETGRSKCRIA